MNNPTTDELKDRPEEVQRLVCIEMKWEFCERHPIRYGIPEKWTAPYCKHSRHTCGRWRRGRPHVNYPWSHNACRTFEDGMSEEEFDKYVRWLATIVLQYGYGRRSYFESEVGLLLRATPLQKCLAFLTIRGRTNTDPKP